MKDEMRPDIAAAWANVTNKSGKKRDVRKIPEYLNGGETVLTMTGGLVSGKNGLLVATDRRALFIAEGLVNHSFEDFPYDRITTVTSQRGMMFGKIIISTAGVSRVVDQVHKSEAEAVAAVIRERVEATTRERYAPAAPIPNPGRPIGIAAELRELAQLRDQGVLTEAEFETEKARILGR
ncbi:PH domain-containing protein [Pseudonocardia kujensis]|uniref:PH domain-containing protein n=1 Tax=Pseudonocardia kujensis TaxID=1128675 RepID=UPI001E294868|nr:PH domain-containing protein [Pseudonocardia kujensis]MCE0768117.1 PH domain-containing protein [Pseudonocardia kujensis]